MRGMDDGLRLEFRQRDGVSRTQAPGAAIRDLACRFATHAPFQGS